MTTKRQIRHQDVSLDWNVIEEVASSRVPPLPPPQAQVELLALLDRLELLAGIPGSQAERDEVAEKIMDVFATYPNQAPTWQSAWRRLHQTKQDEENRR
jgi:hypothetical protein